MSVYTTTNKNGRVLGQAWDKVIKEEGGRYNYNQYNQPKYKCVRPNCIRRAKGKVTPWEGTMAQQGHTTINTATLKNIIPQQSQQQ
jgi:hypothetical protein